MLQRLKGKLKKLGRKDKGLPLPPYPQSWEGDSPWPQWHQSSLDSIPYRPPAALAEQEQDYPDVFAKLRADLEDQRQRQDRLLAELGLRRYDDPHSSIRIEVIDEPIEHSLAGGESIQGIGCYQDRMSRPVDAEDSLGVWPRRLLHVPSMTSLQWKVGHMYGSCKEPRFIAISYTWGRYRIPQEELAVEAAQSPSLPVKGVNWRVPPVRESLFSVSQFEAVLKRAVDLCDVEFVWLDVACIDQNANSTEGALEIGRQAKIFGHADKVFVWLLTPNADEDHNTTSLNDTIKVLDNATQAAFHCQNAHEKLCKDVQWMMQAATGVTDLTNIPWWSSLWTLQEAFIRPDAVLLDTQGQAITTEDGELESLSNILQRVSFVYHFCQSRGVAGRFSDQQDRTDTLIEQGLIRVVERSGLHALGQLNPLLLYTCAKARQSQNPLDRVYGIMQIWGFQLGKAAPGATISDENRSLEDLEIQLGIELIRVFPIESQLHVHTALIADRQAWRVSNSSSIPSFIAAMPFTTKGHLQGNLGKHTSKLGVRQAHDTTYGTFTGPTLPFTSLIEATTQAKIQKCPTGILNLALDENVVFNTGTLQSRCSLRDIPPNRHDEIANLIFQKAAELHRTLIVAFLGCVQTDRRVKSAFGIVLLRVIDRQFGFRWYKRIGICMWDMLTVASLHGRQDLERAYALLEVESEEWMSMSLLFG